jgi:hypothetical protein
VPGTCNEFNWTWRLPASIEEVGEDADLMVVIKELDAVPAAAHQKRSVDDGAKYAK